MADINALKYKCRLFHDGQMIVAKKQMKAIWDENQQSDYDPGWSNSAAYNTVSPGQAMVVLSEGTTKAINGEHRGSEPTLRSIVVFYENNGPKMRKILINPLFGPREIEMCFQLSSSLGKP